MNKRLAAKSDAFVKSDAPVLGADPAPDLALLREEAKAHLGVVLDVSPDIVTVVDCATLAYLYVNESAARVMRLTRNEVMRAGPQRVFGGSIEELTRTLDSVVAAGDAGRVFETEVRKKDGAVLIIEASSRPIDLAGRRCVITVSRDITARKQAEAAAARLAAMLATLSATNEVIMRAESPAALYQQVCEAAIASGKFAIAAVLVPGRNPGKAEVAGMAGGEPWHFNQVAVTLDPSQPTGTGLIGTAYEQRCAVVSNDFLADPRTAPWHGIAQKTGVQSATAVPLLRGPRALGVLTLYSRDKDNFDDESVRLVQRMADNIVFALTAFETEAERRRAEQAAQAADETYRLILNSIEDAYYEVDLAGRLVRFNPALCELLQYEPHELQGMSNRAYMLPDDAARAYRMFNTVLTTGDPAKVRDWAVLRKDGMRVVVEGSVNLVRNGQGEPQGFRGILRDVTERRLIVSALHQSEARFRALTTLSTDWYWEQDSELRFTKIEGAGSGASKGYMAHGAVLGRRLWELSGVVQDANTWLELKALTQQREPFREIEYSYLDAHGRQFYISINGEPVFDDAGVFVGYRGTSRDITERRRAEQRIEYLATHDALTGLPNRVMFGQMLQSSLEAARRYEREFAVLFVDLDRFKLINDTLGHEAGDTLLKEMAQRFRQVLRASDVVARLGGDEFVMLVHEAHGIDDVTAVARKVITAAMRPLSILDQECRVTASVGVARYPVDGEDAATLMKNADIAMYLAKGEGKNNFQFYSDEIKTQSLERMMLEAELRQALERNELSLHYQAKLDLTTERISGVEALLRWNNPQLGDVPPMQFIPLAEETGLIVPIGMWVLRTACAQSMAWQREGLPPLCMAVNLSPRQFLDPHLPQQVAQVLAESGMPPHLLELEITEGMLMQDTERAVRVLMAIKKLGVRIAIDDFGTGYSSLAVLKTFPIDTLKVDRSFIREVAQDSDDRAITEAIIAMGKSLSLTVVAEGVETEQQKRFLTAHACDEMQGYYFSKPCSAHEFAAMLHGTAAPAATVAASNAD